MPLVGRGAPVVASCAAAAVVLAAGVAAADPPSSVVLDFGTAKSSVVPEPVSLVDRPLVLSRGQFLAAVDGQIGRANFVDSILTVGGFDLDARVGVARDVELDLHVPFIYDGRTLFFAGPAVAAQYEFYDRAFELAVHVDVGAAGLASSPLSPGLYVAQGLRAGRAFGERLRFELQLVWTTLVDKDPTFGVSVPFTALVAVNKTFFVSASTGLGRGDMRVSTSTYVPAALTLTQVVERDGHPLFDVGAFVKRPNVFEYSGLPYVIFTAGLGVVVHTTL